MTARRNERSRGRVVGRRYDSAVRTSDEVVARAREIEAALGPSVTHHEVGRALNEELRSNPTSEADADPLVWEVWRLI